MIQIIIYAVAIIVILLLTIIIASATSKNKKLNKTSEALYELLPHLDCGECGRVDCMNFA